MFWDDLLAEKIETALHTLVAMLNDDKQNNTRYVTPKIVMALAAVATSSYYTPDRDIFKTLVLAESRNIRKSDDIGEGWFTNANFDTTQKAVRFAYELLAANVPLNAKAIDAICDLAINSKGKKLSLSEFKAALGKQKAKPEVTS